MSDLSPDTAEIAAQWDARYRAHPWANEPDSELVTLVGPIAPARALDLGCGTGRNARWLAARGWRVTGVDASAVGLEQARRALGEDHGAEWVQADLTTYEPSHPFELVVLANIHLSPADRPRLFELVQRAVAPGGHLYLIGHHRDALGIAGPPEAERLFVEQDLRDAFPELEVDRLERIERPAEGAGPVVVDLLLWAHRNAPVPR